MATPGLPGRPAQPGQGGYIAQPVPAQPGLGQPVANRAGGGPHPAQQPKRPPTVMIRRKPRAADPLVSRKKPTQRPTTAPKVSVLSAASKGDVAVQSLPSEARTLGITDTANEMRKLEKFDAQRKQNGGWTDPPPSGGYRDFPVITTKRALREGIRYHVMRFTKANKGGEDEAEIDPTDQDEFTRPVSLHRRDPRQPAPGRAVKDENGNNNGSSASTTPATADEKEAERLAQAKMEREAQRALDMAQIAPVARDANAKKPAAQNPKKEKQFQMYFPKNTKEQKKESEIRYEEALPWHLEDADGKNVWVGSYVSALSEANVALVISGSAFRMIPLEKFYRFTPKPPFQAYSIEQAEEIMAKKMATGRWAMRDTEKRMAEEELEETRRTIGGRSRVKQESSTYRAAPRSEKMDHDDIDMEGDEFQDDDENVGLEPDNDEDSKDTRERLRRNHLGANLFGDADELKVDKEEEETKAMKRARQLGKQLRKTLAKREDHLEYLVDGETESEKEDFLELSSDEEEEDADGEKKVEEGKAKVDGKDKDKDKDKLAVVGASNASKGNTTPSGRHKTADSGAGKKGKSLKRPGSPNLSESSGNESSRKKPKKHATATSSVMHSRSSTPLPGQHGRSKASKNGAGSGTGAGALSDGEATAGEMSDGAAGGKRRIKIVGAAAKGTPAGSRASSPNPQAATMASGSRPGSPARASSPAPPRASSPNGGGSGGGLVEASEIITALQSFPEGVSVGLLLRRFGNRIGDNPNQMKRKDWIKLVKENAVFGEDKLLRAKAPGSDA